MIRLINLKGTLIDLEYVYKIEFKRPDLGSIRDSIKNEYLVTDSKGRLNDLYHLIPKVDQWTTTPDLINFVYTLNIFYFNKEKSDTFYIIRDEDFNKFMDVYRVYKYTEDILTI